MSLAHSTRALALTPTLTLDARRAAWLPQAKILVVADTHIGYAWVQRQRGQLIPLTAEDTQERLDSLLADYPAQTLIILGDVVHAAVATEALADPLRKLCQRMSASQCQLILVLGNHDTGLPRRIAYWNLSITTALEYSIAGFHFVHGDQPFDTVPPGTLLLSGHEHPSLILSDGVATRAKVPCFLWSKSALLLPAFSNWAAGTVARPGHFLGPVANQRQYTQAFACLGPRILRLPWSGEPAETGPKGRR